MAKLWPSRNSTSVSALRVVSCGIVVPFTMTGLVVDATWQTCGVRWRLMRPVLSTVGSKPSVTPQG